MQVKMPPSSGPQAAVVGGREAVAEQGPELRSPGLLAAKFYLAIAAYTYRQYINQEACIALRNSG